MVGVEIAEQAVVELFRENNIDHVVEDLHDMGKLYKVTYVSGRAVSRECHRPPFRRSIG